MTHSEIIAMLNKMTHAYRVRPNMPYIAGLCMTPTNKTKTKVNAEG